MVHPESVFLRDLGETPFHPFRVSLLTSLESVPGVRKAIGIAPVLPGPILALSWDAVLPEDGERSYVSGEQRAEIKEQTLNIFAVIFRVRVPITVEFFIFLSIIFWENWRV
jgi:hypothetical protein